MKDAYYFSHDANARRDPKIMAMICDFGIEGYGLYWVIVEVLREQDSYTIKNDKIFNKMLVRESGLPFKKVEEFISKSIEEYGLFSLEGSQLYSVSLLKRMDKVNTIKIKRKEAANKRWANTKQLNVKKEVAKKKKEIKPEKKKYLDFVYLTEKEFEKLKQDLSIEVTDRMVTRLNGYIGQIGEKEAKKKYKSHYHVIRNWYSKDKRQAKEKAELLETSEFAQIVDDLNIKLV